MGLTDRYRNPPEASKSASSLSCPHYSPVSGEKRCKDYLAGGACARDDEFMCVEWLKANGHALPTDHPVLAAPEKNLFGEVVPVPSAPKKPRLSRESKKTSPAPTAPRLEVSDEEPKGLPAISKDDIESFRGLGVEVCLRSEEIGDVWIVPEYTGQERKELSIEHAATLCLVAAVFPGATVSSFEKTTETTGSKEPA